MHESSEMPKYLKVSTTAHRHGEPTLPLLWLNGKAPQKLLFPDRVTGMLPHLYHTIGVSNEFPLQLKTDRELVNKITKPNPFVDEAQVIRARKSSVERFRISLRQSSLKTEIVHDTVETHSPSHVVKLLRNSKPFPGTGHTIGTMVAADQTAHDAVSLGRFQEFHIQEAESPTYRACIRVPQKDAVIYDCIRNEQKVVRPPDIVLGVYSPYKDNYKSLAGLPKAFNKKQSMFGYFIDRTDREKKLETISREPVPQKSQHADSDSRLPSPGHSAATSPCEFATSLLSTSRRCSRREAFSPPPRVLGRGRSLDLLEHRHKSWSVRRSSIVGAGKSIVLRPEMMSTRYCGEESG